MAAEVPKCLGSQDLRVICSIPGLAEYLQTGTVDDARTDKRETWYHVRWDDGTGGWYCFDALENLVEEEE